MSKLPPHTQPQGRQMVVPLVIGSAMLLQTMNSMMLISALPTIGQAFAVDPLRLNLAITLYLLPAAAFLPVSGWAADRWGAKRVFLAAVILFAVSAFACGLATNMSQLLVARFVQGIAAAMMMPAGRIVLLRTTPKSQIVDALSMMVVPALIGPMIGPLVGGFIVTYWDWHWIFFSNLPFAVLGVFLIRRYVPSVRTYETPAFDWPGLCLTGGGLALLIIGFELVSLRTSPLLLATCAISGGLGMFWAYAVYARRHANAILDVSLFRTPTFRLAIIGVSISRLAILSTPFLMAIFLQIGWGLSPLQAGLFTFLTAIGSLALRPLAAPILRRCGYRAVLLATSVGAAGLMASFGFYDPEFPYFAVIPILIATGLVRSMQLLAFTTLAFADMDEKQISHASTISSLAMQFIQAISVGVSAMLLSVLVRAFGTAQLTAQTIAPAFWILGGLSLLALLCAWPLASDAGASLHRQREANG